MGYNYETEKAGLFSENGVAILLAVRDAAKGLIEKAGACTCGRVIDNVVGGGSCWTMLAALDYLVERGELRRVTERCPTLQDQVFVSGR